MTEKKEQIMFMQSIVSFPKTEGKTKENKAFFKEIVALIDENKKTLPKEVKVRKETHRLVLDSDNYMITVLCNQCFELRALINEPITNIDPANNLTNTVTSYLNAVLKEKASQSSIVINEIFSRENDVNLASKMVGSAKMAKANEIAKETLTPFAIGFEYVKEDKRYIISSLYSKTQKSGPIQNSVSVQLKLEEPIPFDLLKKQYENLNYSVQLCERLVEGEF